jgi:hypothetical protein
MLNVSIALQRAAGLLEKSEYYHIRYRTNTLQRLCERLETSGDVNYIL